MQRTKKKVQQSKPNHFCWMLASWLAPQGGNTARSPRSGPDARSGRGPFSARRPFPDAARSPGEERRLGTLPSSRSAAAGAVGGAGRTPASPHPPLPGKERPGRRNKGASGPGGGPRCRGRRAAGRPRRPHESILQLGDGLPRGCRQGPFRAPRSSLSAARRAPLGNVVPEVLPGRGLVLAAGTAGGGGDWPRARGSGPAARREPAGRRTRGRGERRSVGGPGRCGSPPGGLLRYRAYSAPLPAPPYRLEKGRRP